MKMSPQFEKYCEIKNAFLAEGIDTDEILSKKPVSLSMGSFIRRICAILLILASISYISYIVTKSSLNNIAIVRVK